MTAAGARGTVAVGVRAEGGSEAFLACLRSVLEHTAKEVPVLVGVPDDARAVAEQLAADGRVRLVDGDSQSIADAAGEADLALLDGTARVGPGWLEELRTALPVDGTAATATALSWGGGVTGLGRSRRALPPDRAPDDLSTSLVRHTRHLHPRISFPGSACQLIGRAALDVAGPLDAEFATRCDRLGLRHVAADGVLVVPLVDGDDRTPLHEDPQPAVARALSQAVRALDGLSVTIDGRALTPLVTGTQVHTLELIAALHDTGVIRQLRVVVPHDLGPNARRALAALDGVHLLPYDEIDDATPKTLVTHRPYQVSGPDDMLLLRRLGERVVITHQDLMNYDIPSYHPDAAAWDAHRRLTAETLAAADAVVAFTRHIADELLAESLIGAERLHVVAPGIDHQLHGLVEAPQPPAGPVPLTDRRFLLCLGSDLRHKNRRFALALLRALRTEHGWDGLLVLAGPSVLVGSSQAEETAELLTDPALADAVVTLPSVDEAGKRWLYETAAAVLYPTLREGFGLVPFEAAAAGTPCLFAAQSALVEHLPPETAHLVPWNAARSAEAVAPLLDGGKAAQRLVEQIRAAGTELTWQRAAAALVSIYEDVVSAPRRRTAELAWNALHSESAFYNLRADIGPTGLSLVGSDGLLPEDIQRTLAALARRRATRATLFRWLRRLRKTAVQRRD